MKKTGAAVIILFILLAHAASAGASDTGLSIGIKVWSSTWKESDRSGTVRSADFNNGTEVLLGPTVSARFLKNWFADFSYLGALGDYESSNWFSQGDSMKFRDRTDADLRIGYLVHDPYNTDFSAGFFATYKTIDASASYTNPGTGINNTDAGNWTLKGPGLGVLAEKHLDELTVLYGSLSYLYLQQEFAFSGGGESRFDTSGWAIEASVARILFDGLSVSMGVQYQTFKGKTANDASTVTDAFSGLTGEIRYAF